MVRCLHLDHLDLQSVMSLWESTEHECLWTSQCGYCLLAVALQMALPTADSSRFCRTARVYMTGQAEAALSDTRLHSGPMRLTTHPVLHVSMGYSCESLHELCAPVERLLACCATYEHLCHALMISWNYCTHVYM